MQVRMDGQGGGADIAEAQAANLNVGERSNLHNGRPMQVFLAQPRGFCAGVVRAIEIVERALEKYGAPVYVRHEIVHNKYVVESLKAKGAVFVEDLSEVPPLAVTVFSAHGVARTVEEEAAARGLPVLNATCPLVTKVHNRSEERRVGKECRSRWSP